MKYDELIKHILENSEVYIEEYGKKGKLEEREKGILQGLWFDVDSIKNQLEIERINANAENNKNTLKKELKLESILKELQKLIEKK